MISQGAYSFYQPAEIQEEGIRLLELHLTTNGNEGKTKGKV
jgi:hypothetical protein